MDIGSLIMLGVPAIYTCLVETILLLAKYKKVIEKPYLRKVGILVNLITNIILNLSIAAEISYVSYVVDMAFLITVAVGEILVIIVEYLLYSYAFRKELTEKKITKKGLFISSIIFNVVSFVSGVFLLYILYP